MPEKGHRPMKFRPYAQTEREGFKEKRLNIALVGFRATGKSTTGQVLAQKLNRTFVDMDEQLVASLGQQIREWVRSHGWESFREAESSLLETLAPREDLVVSTGGGVIIDPFNREILKSRFLVVWLQATAETVYSRLTRDPKSEAFRPALTHLPFKEEVEHLLSERSPWYRETADLILETDTLSPQECVEIIMEFFYKEGRPTR